MKIFESGGQSKENAKKIMNTLKTVAQKVAKEMTPENMKSAAYAGAAIGTFAAATVLVPAAVATGSATLTLSVAGASMVTGAALLSKAVEGNSRLYRAVIKAIDKLTDENDDKPNKQLGKVASFMKKNDDDNNDNANNAIASQVIKNKGWSR